MATTIAWNMATNYQLRVTSDVLGSYDYGFSIAAGVRNQYTFWWGTSGGGYYLYVARSNGDMMNRQMVEADYWESGLTGEIRAGEYHYWVNDPPHWEATGIPTLTVCVGGTTWYMLVPDGYPP